jgi:peptidoglycan/LPS O-acetylase OafA/YrhL
MTAASEKYQPKTGPPQPAPRSFGQVPAWDGLRGVAVLIVFVAHMDVILPIPTLLVIPGATVSLDSFFVLSGFLITALLLREQGTIGTIGVGAFYRRRVLRLLPALYAMVLVNALFAYVTNQWGHTETPSILSVLFYYSNYYSASASGPLSPKLAPGFQHLWSLSFEEQFYLIWPWVTIVALTIRTRLRTVVIVLLSLITIIAVRDGILFEDTHRWWSLFYRTDIRADSILWGALLAHLWVRGKEPRRGMRVAPWIAAAFLLACLPFATQYGAFVYEGGFIAIDISCAILILALLNGNWPGRRLFELKPFVALGIVSYAFYLWHLPVFFAVRYFDTHWPDWVRVVIATAVTLAFTVLSWFLIERPLMRWSRRLEVKRYSRQLHRPVALESDHGGTTPASTPPMPPTTSLSNPSGADPG